MSFAQSALFDGRVRVMWTPTGVTGGLSFGNTFTSSGSFGAAGPTFASVGLLSWVYRGTYANLITTVNQSIGVNTNDTLFYRSTTAGANGGFTFYSRWGFDIWGNGGRLFQGLSSSGTTPVTADPSATNNSVGFAVDAADNGLIYFMTRDGTTTNRTSTGFTIVNNKGYDCWFFCPADGSAIYWRIVDCATGAVATGSTSSNMPVVNTRLAVVSRTSNAALTPAASVRLSIANVYVESAV
jgi:hypothetical protein